MSGRGSNSISAKLRNIVSGSQSEVRYRSDDKVEKAFIGEDDYEFLYQDGEEYWFMNSESYEQLPLKKEEIEDVVGYLLPNTPCKMQTYDDKPIGVSVANTVQFKSV